MNEPVDKLTLACDLIEALCSRIAELEKERDIANSQLNELLLALDSIKRIAMHPKDKAILNVIESYRFNKLEAHNLEQQANGIARFTELHLSGHSLFKSLSANYCSVLLIQVKQLREGVNHE